MSHFPHPLDAKLQSRNLCDMEVELGGMEVGLMCLFLDMGLCEDSCGICFDRLYMRNVCVYRVASLSVNVVYEREINIGGVGSRNMRHQCGYLQRSRMKTCYSS